MEGGGRMESGGNDSTSVEMDVKEVGKGIFCVERQKWFHPTEKSEEKYLNEEGWDEGG